MAYCMNANTEWSEKISVFFIFQDGVSPHFEKCHRPSHLCDQKSKSKQKNRAASHHHRNTVPIGFLAASPTLCARVIDLVSSANSIVLVRDRLFLSAMRSKSSERSHRRQSAKTAADPPTTVATTTATTHTTSSPNAIEAAVEASGVRFNLGDLVICRYSTYPYWPATIDMTHQKKYHREYRCMKRTRGGDSVLAYWCTFSNDDTGGWVRYDRIVPYHPKILEPIKIPKHLDLGQDQFEALKVARGAYYNIPAQARPSQPENLPKDFFSKPKPEAKDPDMLVSDEEDETGAADDTVTSGPSNEEPNDNDEGGIDDDDGDDVDDRKSEEGDRGSVDRNNSRDKRASVVKTNVKNENIEDEVNGSFQKPSKLEEDHAGDTNSKMDNRRRHPDSGDEYSVDHAEDDGGEDPMDLGDPSSDEEDAKPPPPPRSTKQKREPSGRGGRGRGRGGGRRTSGAKRKLPTGNTTATASSPPNMHGNTSAVSTPMSKRARSGTSKANTSEKGDEAAIVNMGRGARRREQQREVDQLRSELSAARKVITDLKGELVKSNSIIADLKSRRVKMNPPEAPDSVPLVKPPKSEYQSKPVSSSELKDVMMKLKNTFQTFKTKVRDAQNKRAALFVRADEMCKEFLEGCDDLEDKESKAVNLESELVDMLSHLITLDIDVMELRPLKMGRLVRSIGRTCKQMPAIHGLAEEIHFTWKAVVDKSMKKDTSAGSQSDSGDEDNADDQSGDDNDSGDESNNSDSGSEEDDGDKDDDDEDDEKEKDDVKMEDIPQDRKGVDVDDNRNDKNKNEVINTHDGDDDDDSESDDSKNKSREEDDDETVPDGSKGKSDPEKRAAQTKAEDKLEENSQKDHDVKERDKPSSAKIEEQEDKVSAKEKNERDEDQASDEEDADGDKKAGKSKKQEAKNRTSKADKEGELEKDTKMKDVSPGAAAEGDTRKKGDYSGPFSNSKDRKRKMKSGEVKTESDLAKDSDESDGFDEDDNNDGEKRATVRGKERKGKTLSTLNGDTAAKKLLVRGKDDDDDDGESSRDAVSGKAPKESDKKSRENSAEDKHKPDDYRKRQEKPQRASKASDAKKSDDKNNSDMPSHREDKVGEKRSRSNVDDDDAGRGRKAKRETIGKKQPLFRGTAN